MKMLCCIIFLTFLTKLQAQDSSARHYGLHVINDTARFNYSVQQNNCKAMCDIRKIIPGIFINLRYTSADNFTKHRLYPAISTSYLRVKAAKALKQVQQELSAKGLGLKIFDAYRPYSTTVQMWEYVKDERYTADPKKGSGHNRGVAVDLTIIQLKNKKELNMGTGFDNFTDSAHHQFTALKKEVLENRKMLRSVMERHGFVALETEWWHYSLPDSKEYEILDLSFTELKKLTAGKITTICNSDITE